MWSDSQALISRIFHLRACSYSVCTNAGLLEAQTFVILRPWSLLESVFSFLDLVNH